MVIICNGRGHPAMLQAIILNRKICPMETKDRIKPIEELAPILEAARTAGKKVVTTNGVYDFIHAGHLDYLEEAAALGDILVIAINTDASVQRIKGPTRPINTEMDRALILAGLRCVDYVTFFDSDDPREVLSQLKPTIHAKGGDYDPEKMPETATIRAHGGDVKILSLKPGYSNSKQFEKILKAAEADGTFERPEWLTDAQKDK